MSTVHDGAGHAKFVIVYEVIGKQHEFRSTGVVLYFQDAKTASFALFDGKFCYSTSTG